MRRARSPVAPKTTRTCGGTADMAHLRSKGRATSAAAAKTIST
ncbi:hypothetical protein [Amycolatopsis sp. FBCC-B4732]|nr:hypothetical protein [Amycolatopsis sp. FBCC-B4732]